MTESARDRVACPVCTKTYRWRAQLAGHKIRCKSCESIFRVPADPSSEAELVPPGPNVKEETSGASGYELDTGDVESSVTAPGDAATERGKCPSCNSPIAAHAVICINCGFNLKEGKKVKTAVEGGAAKALRDEPPKTAKAPTPPSNLGGLHAIRQDKTAIREAGANAERSFKIIDLYLPIGLIVLGVIVTFASNMYNEQIAGMLQAILVLTLQIVFSVPLYLVGIVLTAKIMQTSFGPLHLALLKLVAIAVGPFAIGTIVKLLIHLVDDTGLMGWFGGLFVEVVLYWTLLAILFSLEFLETVVCILVIRFVNMIAIPVAMYLTLYVLSLV